VLARGFVGTCRCCIALALLTEIFKSQSSVYYLLERDCILNFENVTEVPHRLEPVSFEVAASMLINDTLVMEA
jgi:hypothetical protein